MSGGKFFRFAETLVDRIPLVRGIYQAIKQIVQTMVSKEGQSFKRVVLVEFPQAGALHGRLRDGGHVG